jgi:bifunctional DNA-binding transcriptional regulator/antitoxin component of YhaV-PrlF toxin-antitoxin module
MSTSAIHDRQQTMLPDDVSAAAGLKPGDQVDWRFEDGEIRGRKLPSGSEPRRIVGRLVRRGGTLVCDTAELTIDPDDIARAIREERDR